MMNVEPHFSLVLSQMNEWNSPLLTEWSSWDIDLRVLAHNLDDLTVNSDATIVFE